MSEGEGGHEHGHSALSTFLEIMGMGHGLSEFAGVHHATEGFNTGRFGAQAMQIQEAEHLSHGIGGAGVGNWFAPFALMGGINGMINGEGPMEKFQGGLETFSGGVGTLGLAGSAATSMGATGAGGAMTGAAAIAAPAAAVAGAGALGLGIGNFGNSTVAEKGWLGQDEEGKGRDWSDWWGDKVFPGGSQYNINNAANAGPLLLAAGAGAVGTAAVGAGESISDWMFPGIAAARHSVEDQQKAQHAQQSLDHSSHQMYETMLSLGQNADTARIIASALNPGFQPRAK